MNSELTAYITSLPASKGRGHTGPLADKAIPSGSFWLQLRDAGLIWRFGALLASHGFETLFLLASWAAVGSGVLSGRTDIAWLGAWALCLVSVVLLRVLSKWLEGVLAIGLGGLLRQRLLTGAMAIDADVLRRKGVGETLGEVFEADALESLATSGGIQLALAAVELAIVPFLLLFGASGPAEALVLAGWICLMFISIYRNTQKRAHWTKSRLDLTHRLVENMTAQRTRLAQQESSEWHVAEDCENKEYIGISEKLDGSTAWIEGLLPRGYLVAALLAFFPSFISGGASLQRHALTLGTILFAYTSIQKLAYGVSRGASAYLAWRVIQPVFNAAARTADDNPSAGLPGRSGRVLQMQDVTFAHEGQSEKLLAGCSLKINSGDALLLEGESGSGKSTLALLMAGMRKPSKGFILARGLDLHTLGESDWRRRVALTPQFHENHILSASLSFNLLMSRTYPHSEQDLREAQQVCQELGLGELLERMPSGMDQVIGETGWQLSQGERSRIFLARALLQNADLIVLDESFAMLDPENLQQCLESVRRRAKTLMVIAHP
jgi:ATP-binding cassette, subfamily B, bacterial